MKRPYHLLAVLLDVLSARDVYPEVFAVGGLDDGLIEVGVIFKKVEPLLANY